MTLKVGGAAFVAVKFEKLALETLLINPDDEGEPMPVFTPSPAPMVAEADNGAESEADDGKLRSMYT